MLTLIPCSKRGGLRIEEAGDFKEGARDLIALSQYLQLSVGDNQGEITPVNGGEFPEGIVRE
jgi:hypothetical protein